MEHVKRFAEDVTMFDAVREYLRRITQKQLRLSITDAPDEVVGQNAKAAILAEKNIESAFDALASERDTYAQPETPGHV